MGGVKVMDAAAALRSTTEMLDGMRVLVKSCEWTIEKGCALGPIGLVGV